MGLDHFFDKNLVFCLEADNQEQLFNQVASLLEERDIVTPTYREALIAREKSFPTGLDMEFLGKDLPNVAIPHTDIVHNLAEKVVVVRLEKPVTFHNMIAPDREVEVSLLFFIINNRYGISTDITYSTKIPHLYMRADAYGIPGHYVEDGNDLMAVYEKMHEVINYVRSGNGPAIVEVESYRWFGHSTADAGVYRTKEEVDSWKAKDPVKRYRAYLIENEIATEEELAAIEAQVIKEVEEGVKFAEESPFPDMSVAFEDVFVD